MAGYKNRHILTFTGKLVDPFDIKQEDIDIVDIAHALAFICRYNGHTKFFYSVAQHSLMVEKLVSDWHPNVPLVMRLRALLHDASEAYIHDISGPLKVEPEFTQYRIREKALELKIYDKFHLMNLDIIDHKLIKDADHVALRIEQTQIMRWSNDHTADLGQFRLEDYKIENTQEIPELMASRFISKFFDLYGRINYQQTASESTPATS